MIQISWFIDQESTLEPILTFVLTGGVGGGHSGSRYVLGACNSQANQSAIPAAQLLARKARGRSCGHGDTANAAVQFLSRLGYVSPN